MQTSTNQGLMTISDWIAYPGHFARALRSIHDTHGYVRRGDIGEICDVDTANDCVIVDFPTFGAVLCDPDEIQPAPR